MRAHAPPNAKAAPGQESGRAWNKLTMQKSHARLPQTSQNREHAGFFRVSERTWSKILLAFEEPCDQRAAMLAYVTLCRKVNLRGSETFEDTIRSLASDMAYSYRDAQKAVRLVESIGLVHVQRRKIPGTKANAPSIYTVKTYLQNVTRLKPDVRSSWEDEAQSTSPQLSQELPQEIHPYIAKEDARYE